MMLPLLVWLAGCAFGFWCIWHFGFYREAAAFAVCTSVLVWMVGGAGWIGKQLAVARAAKLAARPRDQSLARLTPNDVERAALKRSTEQASSEQRS
jgi:hypothetical protein